MHITLWVNSYFLSIINEIILSNTICENDVSVRNLQASRAINKHNVNNSNLVQISVTYDIYVKFVDLGLIRPN